MEEVAGLTGSTHVNLWNHKKTGLSKKACPVPRNSVSFPIMPTDAAPRDFAEAMKKAGLADFFANCAPSHQREYLKWITEAKKPETRQARIAKALKMLAEKRRE
jgi:hypothetical protein